MGGFGIEAQLSVVAFCMFGEVFIFDGIGFEVDDDKALWCLDYHVDDALYDDDVGGGGCVQLGGIDGECEWPFPEHGIFGIESEPAEVALEEIQDGIEIDFLQGICWYEILIAEVLGDGSD